MSGLAGIGVGERKGSERTKVENIRISFGIGVGVFRVEAFKVRISEDKGKIRGKNKNTKE
jgi:hypothetical protein